MNETKATRIIRLSIEARGYRVSEVHWTNAWPFRVVMVRMTRHRTDYMAEHHGLTRRRVVKSVQRTYLGT